MSKISILQLQRQPANGYQTSQKCFRISAKTGVMAAGLAANGVIFALKPGQVPNYDSPAFAYIERIRLQWTTLTAFTTPVTAGRGIKFGIGTAAEPTGGSNIPDAAQKVGGVGAGGSVFGFAAGPTGGRIQIATTAALAGPVPSAPHIGEISLAGFGAAGASKEAIFDFTANDTEPLGISVNSGLPNLLFYSSQLMDAAGTFELIIEVDTCELPDGYVIPS